MNRTAGEVARVLGVESEQVKRWACAFKEFLGGSANPRAGTTRTFSDSDLLMLAYIYDMWEETPDLAAISAGLASKEHLEPRFLDLLYRHTPLLQEPPDDLDETWRHGLLLNGAGMHGYRELARNYRLVAENILDTALQNDETLNFGYPVLFAYRHALELHLKILGEIDEVTHSLERCVHLVEKRHGGRIASRIRNWILDLDKVDPEGTFFRYADMKSDRLAHSEYWLDLVRFRLAMSEVLETLDLTSLRLNTNGKPVRKRS